MKIIRSQSAAHILALLLLIVLAYYPSLDNTFHFDDFDNIYRVSAIKAFDFSLSGFERVIYEAHLPDRVIPNISFAIDWNLGKGDPGVFLITNLILHCANAVLVYLLIHSLLGIFSPEHTRRVPFIALVCALLWAVHPIQVQSVTYIVQRMAEFAAFFIFLSTYCYFLARTAARFRRWFFLSAVMAFIAGVLSKENALIIPFLWGLVEIGVVHHGKAFAWGARKNVWIYLLLAAGCVVLVLGVVPGNAISARVLPGYEMRDFSLIERLLTQPRVIFFYLSEIIYPAPGRFSLEHDFVVSTDWFSPASTLPAILAIIVWFSLGIGCLLKQSRRLLGFALLWILATLFIESSIVPLEMVFEHRMYVPLMGLVLLLAVSLFRITGSEKRKTLVWVLTVSFVAYCGWSTYTRLPDWRTKLSLYEVAARHAPNASRTWLNLATYYLQDDPDLIKAESAFRRAEKLDPDNALLHENFGVMLMDKGDYEGASRSFSKALRLGATSPSLFNHLGELAFARKDHRTASEYYRQALQLDPENTNVMWNMALALEGLSECKEAFRYWQMFLQRAYDRSDRQQVEEHLVERYQSATGVCFDH